VGVASIVVVAGERSESLAHTLGRLADHAPDGTQLIVAAEDVSAERAERLAALDAVDPGAPGVVTEVVWLTAGLGHATALNSGVRRAMASVVIVLDASLEPSGDFITPLVRALDDPGIGVAGAFGLRSGDLRHFEPAPAGDVDTIDGCLIAFRRDDYAARGPLDEKFRLDPHLDTWWSLVLRDEGEDSEPRRAVAIALPVGGHEGRDHAGPAGTVGPAGPVGPAGALRDRQTKRNFYRVIERFGARRDLLLAPAGTKRRRSGK
jgi:hypothetical protein